MNKNQLFIVAKHEELENNEETSVFLCDISKICRICMREANDVNDPNQHSIKTKLPENELILLRDVINVFLSIKVNEDERLPRFVCGNCTENARTSYNFKNLCEKSDAVLQTYLETIENESSCNDLQTIKDEPSCNECEDDIYEINDSSSQVDEDNRMKEYFEDFTDSSEAITTNLPENKSLYSDKLEEVCANAAQPITEIITNAYNEPLKPSDKHSRKIAGNCNATKKEFICNYCNQTFAQAQTLARHTKIHQTDQKNKLCTFCGKCFMRSDDLKRHTRIHTGERPYACDQCPKKYKQTSELKEHQKSHSKEKHYVCTECGKALATRNGLYVHMKAHKGLKNHECKICGNKYVTSGELTSHIKHIHTKMKPFTCSYDGCARAFATKLSLRAHLQAHSGEKPFSCPICLKGLATSASLQEHKRTHTGHKPKECTVCQRRLGNSQALKKHMRIHTGERPFQCDNCRESFISGSSLSAHIKLRHHQVKQHECSVCGDGFITLANMKQHLLEHFTNQASRDIVSQ